VPLEIDPDGRDVPERRARGREVHAVRILVLNCGSSSLKFELFSFGESSADGTRLAEGNVGGIGGRATIRTEVAGGGREQMEVEVADHGAATRWALQWLGANVMREPPDGVGHRVVHGGPRLFAPAVIDERVLGEITAAGELAPLHNGGALDAIRTARDVLGEGVPMVAVFDTAFHHDLPERAARYAIPFDMADAHGIRRYGFHGLAHRYMSERAATLMRETPAAGELRLITMQLGSGCSAAAIRGGRPLDTSMGFSPLEGLVMVTRSGDIDPAVVRYLCEHGRMTVGEVDAWLNQRCGLLGVSGASGDVRELLARESRGGARAALAIDMFCYRLRKYIGSYLAVLGGADAVVFGGGIGENAAEIRARTCRGMEWCGLRLDEGRNARVIGVEGEISADGSPVRALVIPVDEESVIARDTLDCLREHRGRSNGP
jgi:acetate kinase